MIELTLTALSPSMEKGTLVRWLVQPGDLVRPGDRVVEIETDKTSMELEAEHEGRVSQLLVPDGSEDVLVGTVIATLAPADVIEAVPIAAQAATPAAVIALAPEPVGASPQPSPPVAAKAGPSPSTCAQDTTPATALARSIAKAQGIPLESLNGSGPNGKVVMDDLVLRPATRPVVGRPVLDAPATAASLIPPPEGVPVETTAISGMRKAIARRLSASKREAPHFYLTARCNLDRLLEFRTELNRSLSDQTAKVSVNDLLLKAMAFALVQVPEANVQFGGDVLHRFERIDISMAVAVDGGLVTPVLRDVENLSISQIAHESIRLATKARDGALQPGDYEGGTASLSNLGMLGIDEIVPVLNPPQALILGVGAGIRQPWDVGGQIALATIMSATGSFDHRAIDGAVAARFMAAFKEGVQSPLVFCT